MFNVLFVGAALVFIESNTRTLPDQGVVLFERKCKGSVSSDDGKRKVIDEENGGEVRDIPLKNLRGSPPDPTDCEPLLAARECLT